MHLNTFVGGRPRSWTFPPSSTTHLSNTFTAAGTSTALGSPTHLFPEPAPPSKHRGAPTMESPSPPRPTHRHRRGSHDEFTTEPRVYEVVDVLETRRRILEQEDTDGDCQITVTDRGPKVIHLGSWRSAGYQRYDVRGHYALANLLQELTLAVDGGHRWRLRVEEHRLLENPVQRLSRMIRHHFWDGLTRRIDAEGLELMLLDPKMHAERKRIYVPHGDEDAWACYSQLASEKPHLCLDVIRLPLTIDADFVHSLNLHPGLLSLALEKIVEQVQDHNGVTKEVVKYRGLPFVVPGGRFNEMYGWDSYFESLGLLVDGRWSLARSMVDQFVYEITHYGKILNANRSYYLTRSQPPYLTDMILQVYQYHSTHSHQQQPQLNGVSLSSQPSIQASALGEQSHESSCCKSHFNRCVFKSNSSFTFPSSFSNSSSSYFTFSTAKALSAACTCEEAKKWIWTSFNAAIKEYLTVWMATPRLVPELGLSRYHPTGRGLPPETEPSHFHAILLPFAERHGLSVQEFQERYQDGSLVEPELDRYFVHDRAVRESGHDTTYRLEGRCADLCPVDLNCLLYRYEMDIARVIKEMFDDQFTTADGQVFKSDVWLQWAAERKERMQKLLWHKERGLFFDYDCQLGEQSSYESVTTFYPLWAGLATTEQAERIVKVALPMFEAQGGLVTGTERSRGEIGLTRPNRQWDYPFGSLTVQINSIVYGLGWAPLQMIAWRGLISYGYTDIARRLAYRWLYMITKAFVDFNGVVPEKFDVVTLNHKVNVEYGNVGVDFKFIPREGFGWMNASYEVGLTLMTDHMRRALGALCHPDVFFCLPKHRQDHYRRPSHVRSSV